MYLWLNFLSQLSELYTYWDSLVNVVSLDSTSLITSYESKIKVKEHQVLGWRFSVLIGNKQTDSEGKTVGIHSKCLDKL